MEKFNIAKDDVIFEKVVDSNNFSYSHTSDASALEVCNSNSVASVVKTDQARLEHKRYQEQTHVVSGRPFYLPCNIR